MLDYEGSGTDKLNAADLEAELDRRLESCWPGATKTIVIEPELDIWMWGNDNNLREVLDWPRHEPIRRYLSQPDLGFQFSQHGKPDRPKEALEALIPVHKKQRSSAMYRTIAERASLRRCVDPAFIRLREQLRQWFPPGTAE